MKKGKSITNKIIIDKKSKQFLSKKQIIIISINSLMIASSLAITLPILQTKLNEQNIYYKFNNQYFNSKEDIYNYSYYNSINNNYEFETNKYVFDDLVFNSKEELNEYVENKFEIKNISTKRNPNDYVINTAGELSSLVKTSDSENIQTIYKGINGSSFLTEQDAKETYLDNYSLNYEIDNQLFDNFYSAREFYLNNKLEELENSKNKVIAYEQGAMMQSQEQIINWLRNNTVKGFEYNNQNFSDLNYSEFLNVMKDLDDDIIDENIKPVINANKASYWVTQNLKSGSSGHFVGPKYFESNENVKSETNFIPIKTYNVNAAMPLLNIGLFADITNRILTSETETITSDYNMIDYLDNLFNTLNLNKELLDEFKKFYYSIIDEKLQNDLSKGLTDVEDAEMTDFYRLLISFKRFLTMSKVYDIKIKSNELETILKQIIVEILNSQKDFMNETINISEDDHDGGANVLLDLSFDEIYSIFLNTEAFYNDGGSEHWLWEMNQKIMNAVDSAMEVVEVIGGFARNGSNPISQVKNNIIDMENDTNRSDENFQKKHEENLLLIENALMIPENNKAFIESFGIKLNTNKRNPILAACATVAAVWNLGQMLSFTSLKTYEAKLDSSQSLFYFETTYNIPLTNVTFGSKVLDQNIDLLSPASTNNFPSNTSELYEFNGKYYKEKQNAKNDLIKAIYKTPENYLQTKELYTSVLDKDSNHVILDLKKVSNDKTDIATGEYISKYEYETQLAIAKEEYVQSLFAKYYESTGKEYYLDGFGGAYNDKETAVMELQNKASDINNYKEVYTYWMENKKVVKDSKSEIQEFIQDNQIIDSKSIINTDLIETSYYDNLIENNGYDYEIYQINYYGNMKYFRTYLEAMEFLENQINYEVYSYLRNESTYVYKGTEYLNKQQFDFWIDNQIQTVSKKEYLSNSGGNK